MKLATITAARAAKGEAADELSSDRKREYLRRIERGLGVTRIENATWDGGVQRSAHETWLGKGRCSDLSSSGKAHDGRERHWKLGRACETDGYMTSSVAHQ